MRMARKKYLREGNKSSLLLRSHHPRFLYLALFYLVAKSNYKNQTNNKYYTVIGLISRASIPQQYTSVHNKLYIFPSFHKNFKLFIVYIKTEQVAELQKKVQRETNCFVDFLFLCALSSTINGVGS